MTKKHDEVLLSEEYGPGKCNVIYKRHGENKYFVLTAKKY